MQKCSATGCDITEGVIPCECKDKCGRLMCLNHRRQCTHCKKQVLYDDVFDMTHHTGCVFCSKCAKIIRYSEIRLVHGRPCHLDCIPAHLKRYAREIDDGIKKVVEEPAKTTPVDQELQKRIETIEKDFVRMGGEILELKKNNEAMVRMDGEIFKLKKKNETMVRMGNEILDLRTKCEEHDLKTQQLEPPKVLKKPAPVNPIKQIQDLAPKETKKVEVKKPVETEKPVQNIGWKPVPAGGFEGGLIDTGFMDTFPNCAGCGCILTYETKLCSRCGSKPNCGSLEGAVSEFCIPGINPLPSPVISNAKPPLKSILKKN